MMTLAKNFSLAVLLAAAFLMLAFILFAKTAFAQDASPSAEPESNPPDAASQYNITFPIDGLGDCADMGACESYCQDPVNATACIDYARTQGFYQEDASQSGEEEFWQRANGILGCNTAQSCIDVCADAANHQKCDEFARSERIPGGYVHNVEDSDLLDAAQDALGCDTPDACRDVCEDPANSQKCTDFANNEGIAGGQLLEGPGGCTSVESCRSYCSDPANFAVCDSNQGGNFNGPNGCDSPESCRTVCETNPEICRSYAPSSNGVYVPVQCGEGQFHGPGGVCTNTDNTREAAECVGSRSYWNGSECQDEPPSGVNPDVSNGNFGQRESMGDCNTPGECFDWCVANPGECGENFDPDGPRPPDGYTPYIYYTPGTEVTFEPRTDMGNCDSPGSCFDWCSANAGECGGFDEDSPRPIDVYVPGTYYTPPTDAVYVTPPDTNYYVTPIYFTPPEGSTYTSPQYYTPGTYSSPTYYSPPSGSNYSSPTYYTPGTDYATPSGEYPSPNYTTPRYYTPPAGSNYTTPYYYTPPQYTTPHYYTPPTGSDYTTPNYTTPTAYTTPVYYTPYTGGNYTSPTYYTPPTYTSPTYYTPPEGSNYTSPTYYTPPPPYTSPTYYTP